MEVTSPEVRVPSTLLFGVNVVISAAYISPTIEPSGVLGYEISSSSPPVTKSGDYTAANKDKRHVVSLCMTKLLQT